MVNLSFLLDLTDTSRLETELLRALNSNPNAIPTQKACERGWPREVKVVRVRELRVDVNGISATVDISFTECFGTGCSETFAETPRRMECQLSISRPSGNATLSLVEGEVIDEF